MTDYPDAAGDARYLQAMDELMEKRDFSKSLNPIFNTVPVISELASAYVQSAVGSLAKALPNHTSEELLEGLMEFDPYFPKTWDICKAQMMQDAAEAELEGMSEEEGRGALRFLASAVRKGEYYSPDQISTIMKAASEYSLGTYELPDNGGTQEWTLKRINDVGKLYNPDQALPDQWGNKPKYSVLEWDQIQHKLREAGDAALEKFIVRSYNGKGTDGSYTSDERFNDDISDLMYNHIFRNYALGYKPAVTDDLAEGARESIPWSPSKALATLYLSAVNVKHRRRQMGVGGYVYPETYEPIPSRLKSFFRLWDTIYGDPTFCGREEYRANHYGDIARGMKDRPLIPEGKVTTELHVSPHMQDVIRKGIMALAKKETEYASDPRFIEAWTKVLRGEETTRNGMSHFVGGIIPEFYSKSFEVWNARRHANAFTWLEWYRENLPAPQQKQEEPSATYSDNERDELFF